MCLPRRPRGSPDHGLALSYRRFLEMTSCVGKVVQRRSLWTCLACEASAGWLRRWERFGGAWSVEPGLVQCPGRNGLTWWPRCSLTCDGVHDRPQCAGPLHEGVRGGVQDVGLPGVHGDRASARDGQPDGFSSVSINRGTRWQLVWSCAEPPGGREFCGQLDVAVGQPFSGGDSVPYRLDGRWQVAAAGDGRRVGPSVAVPGDLVKGPEHLGARLRAARVRAATHRAEA